MYGYIDFDALDKIEWLVNVHYGNCLNLLEKIVGRKMILTVLSASKINVPNGE